MPRCGVAAVVIVSSTLCGVAVVVVMLSSTPCGVAVVVAMASSTPYGIAVVVVMVSSTPCGVAVVDNGFIQPLWCGCGAGNGGGIGFKASLSCRSFGCQTYFNIIQGLRFRVQWGSKKCGSLMVQSVQHLLTCSHVDLRGPVVWLWWG